MIYTSSYENFKTNKCNCYSISGNRGKDANYRGKCYSKLAPKLSFWKIWYDNIGKIPEEENNRYYIEEYFNQVLSKLNSDEVYRELDESTLLCYESNEEFCHRHIVAAWFEICLGISVPEVKITDYNIEELERPKYIKECLNEIVKHNKVLKK